MNTRNAVLLTLYRNVLDKVFAARISVQQICIHMSRILGDNVAFTCSGYLGTGLEPSHLEIARGLLLHTTSVTVCSTTNSPEV